MQSSSLSPHTFQHRTQDSTGICLEGNNLPVEVHDHDHDHDHGLRLGSLSFEVKSTPGDTAKEAIAVDSVNRLPEELLSEIFLACAHTLDESELIEMNKLRIPPHHYRLMFAPNAIPYTISSVCKRWRSIGLSLPRLWSKLTIPYVNFRGRDSELEKFMVALRTWLKRSNDHLLQFSCLSGWSTGEEIFRELFENLHRWHVAYFLTDWATDAGKQWLRRDGSKAENLDTLEFRHCDKSLSIPFLRLPNLRRMAIPPDCLAVEEARGLSLTHLTLTRLEGNTTTFFSYLRQFPSLISFQAPVNQLKDDLSHTPLTPFTHKALIELTITEYRNSDSLRNILANIHLPSIRRLRLNYRYRAYETHSERSEMANIVNDFIHRHESTFTDFELSDLEISSDEMIETLHMFPKYLTSYRSPLRDLTDKNVKRLTLDPSNPSQDLAPGLSSISLYVERDDGPSGDLLAKMILSRWMRNPHTTFQLEMAYTGLNPLSDSRIVRRMQQSPGLLLLYR